MLKAEVTKEFTRVELNGTLPKICSDLTNVFEAIIKRLEEKDTELALKFKVMFATGFANGVVFGEDKEHMDHYIALGSKAVKDSNKNGDVIKAMEEQIRQLKKLRDMLNALKEESDEAE